MKQIGKPIHIALGTMVIAALFAAGVVAPHMRNMKSVREGIANLQADLTALGSRVQRAREVFQRVQDKEQALASFAEAIPNRVQLGEFLESVDRLAQDAGVTNKNVTPSTAMVQDDLGCLPIQIRFSGGFASVYEFVEKLEGLPRVARVQQFELYADDDLPDVLVSSMTLHVYFRNG